jgi:hypothetical protein
MYEGRRIAIYTEFDSGAAPHMNHEIISKLSPRQSLAIAFLRQQA